MKLQKLWELDISCHTVLFLFIVMKLKVICLCESKRTNNTIYFLGSGAPPPPPPPPLPPGGNDSIIINY